MAKGLKTGGRKKTSKNKKTKQWSVFTSYCLNGGLAKFEKELNKLTGKDFVQAFTNLLEFHKPKLARNELKHEGEIAIKNIIKLSDGTEITI